MGGFRVGVSVGITKFINEMGGRVGVNVGRQAGRSIVLVSTTNYINGMGEGGS